jgi:mannobiose 2-epimerase
MEMDLSELKLVFKKKVEDELLKDILPFWIKYDIDEEFGGFYGQITNELKINKKAPKGSVLCSRILWAYSAAYSKYQDSKYLEVAKRAYGYLLSKFWDEEYLGVYWMLDYKGNPIDTTKQIYSEAFAIYALTEYYKVTKEEEALNKAKEIYKVMQKYSYDSENKGYFEAYTREWKPKEDMHLSYKELNEKKSMNTHLHVLEAYTNLYRVWKDKEFENKFRELIDVTIKYIIDNDTWHFKLFFDEKWNSKMGTISYGHDIEGSWLLFEAAEVLQDKDVLERVKRVSINMAEASYKEAIDSNGGLLNEKHEDGQIDRAKHWWPQAEAVIGYLNAYQLTGKEYFFKAAYEMWSYIEENIVDKKNGEWFRMAMKENDKLYKLLMKVDPWKCPYHNSRVCLEVMRRLVK